MKVAICSSIEKEKLKKILSDYGFEVVNKKPDFVLCYGGDGTILYAERLYLGIQKLIIKTTGECREYDYHPKLLDSILKKVRDHNYLVLEELKLEALYKNKILIGLNEVQIHTKLPTRAVRFSIFVDNKKFENLVGDGAIVSTPFGSTGYYLATGGRQFKEGIGLSFNNLHSKKIFPFIVSENSKIRIRIDRDSAILLSDNNPKYFSLEKGDEINVQKSSETARFILVNK